MMPKMVQKGVEPSAKSGIESPNVAVDRPSGLCSGRGMANILLTIGGAP
jgi:hypothetical protein